MISTASLDRNIDFYSLIRTYSNLDSDDINNILNFLTQKDDFINGGMKNLSNYYIYYNVYME